MEARAKDDGSREFLVEWEDGAEAAWVAQKYLSTEVMNDFDQGLEYGQATGIVEERKDANGEREFLVEWADGADACWIPEVDTSADMVVMWDAQVAGKNPVEAWRAFMVDKINQEKLDAQSAMAEAEGAAQMRRQIAYTQMQADNALAGGAEGAAGVAAPTGRAGANSALEAELGQL